MPVTLHARVFAEHAREPLRDAGTMSLGGQWSNLLKFYNQ